MGLYGSTPKAPDPKDTAAAQTSTNIGTAIANGYLGNVNQVTPDGSLTYSQTGTNKWTDPQSGDVYDLPTWTATTSLSPAQQAIKAQEDAASKNLATLANTQSGRLNTLLANPFTMNGAPAAGDVSKLTAPSYQQFNSGPQLQSSIGNTGSIQNSIANAGNIQKGVASSGNIQTALGNAGDITKSYDVNFDTSKYEDALMQRLNPQLSQSREALETKLAGQGLQPGSDAYNRAIDAATRQENDARIGAVLNAGQEQSRLAGLAANQAAFQNSAQQQNYNQLLGSGQFANSAQAQQYGQNANNMQMGNAAQAQQFSQNAAQQQANNTAQQQSYQQALSNANLNNSSAQQMYANQNSATAANNALKDQGFNSQQAIINAQNAARSNYLNENYAQRNQNINEVLGLASGAQVSNPNFVATQGQSIPTVDYAGLINQDYQNKLAASQQQQGMFGSILGGVGSLFALSDETAKKDVKKVGGLYEYRYKGESKNAPKRIGVMAQEVEGIRPDAVRTGKDGLKRVNYGALFQMGAR
ncbi:hypothetical protein ASG25_10620 [Rhizobium sp. Leaf384]|uniref:tail fiber domain-containing protein n=1 Tax=Rhizobium sp. Leaf384 TaxID=1736358 RepID=UPI000713E68C|nr:tail fiber domain-containing protein [Rhizobium sp. Leaf384]KQS79031.1 hypothetical protein ASG25_10620 [Rhizobium sp. Leaf384]